LSPIPAEEVITTDNKDENNSEHDERPPVNQR